MKNISVWSISTLLGLFVLTGCAVHPRFRSVDVNTPEEALGELCALKRSITRFTAPSDFTIRGPFGRYSFKGEIDYSLEDGWRVKLTGPFGMKLAVIESVEDRFLINLPHGGITTEIDPDSCLEFPEIDVITPHLSFMMALLLPAPAIDDMNKWTIDHGEAGQPGTLVLTRIKGDSSVDSLVISLDYSPLKLLGEDLWRGDKLRMRRRFKYRDPADNMAGSIVIETADMMLNVRYKSVRMDVNRETSYVSYSSTLAQMGSDGGRESLSSPSTVVAAGYGSKYIK